MKNFSFSLVLAALLMVPTMLFAQNQVSGVVLDAANGEPVIGASILEVGTTNGTITDWEGNFTLTCAPGAQVTISYMGYKSQTLPATAQMTVKLGEDNELLDEVVVVGYGVAKKNDMTGSVTAIKPDEKNKGLTTNAQDMIQGKIAGVNVVSNSGAPGGGATIRVRGGSSLNASNDPLIVIDGMAMDNTGVKGLSNPLSMVNPNDIESFTVLKDASATAIYGSRGSNGVIIITTKKGSKGSKPTVSYNGNVSIAAPLKLVDVMNASQYRQFVTDYYGEGSDAYNLMGDANTNWQKEIYRTAVSTDHNISIMGGVKNDIVDMPYRVSAGYTLQNGVLKNDNPDFQRTTANLNLNPSFLNNHLNFNFNAKFMYARNNYAGTDAIQSAVRMDPTQPVYADDEVSKNNFGGFWQWQNDGAALNDPTYPTTQNPNSSVNPVSQLKEKKHVANSYDFQTGLEADYKIHGFEDLRLHAAFSADYANGNETKDYQPWGPSNFYYGNHSYTTEQKYNMTFNTYAQYYKDFEAPHHLDVMLGYEWSHAKYWGNNNWYGMYPTTNTGSDDAGNPVAGTLYKPGQGEWAQENYLVSFMGRANYIALDRYMLSVTVRVDGSSRFKKHWATFPAVALGWKINEEDFLKDVKEIDELKLRLNWGMTGQQEGIGNYNYFASYNANINNTDGRYPIPGINPDGLLYRPDAYNEDLTWETTYTSGIGIDYSFFRSRLTGSIDYYHRRTKDLLNYTSVPVGSNFRNQVWSNIGTMMNQGVEFNVTGRPVQTKNWQWEISANFAYNQNKITSLIGDGSIVKTGGIGSGTGNTVQVQKVGEPMRSFYVYQQVYGEDGKPLEGVYVDRNADGKISEEDLYCYKNPTAPWVFGLSTRLNFYNFDLGISFHANVGNYVYNDRQASYVNVEKRYDSSFSYLQNATAQAVANGWQTYDHVLSDYFVENASFLKCDNITLGYSFNGLGKSDTYKGVSGRVYVTANNVFTITKYSGVDPEISGGIDGTIYPRPFSGVIGVNLNF